MSWQSDYADWLDSVAMAEEAYNRDLDEYANGNHEVAPNPADMAAFRAARDAFDAAKAKEQAKWIA